MTTLRKAAEQALESMVIGRRDFSADIEALRAALRRDALNEVHQMDHENRDADELDMIGGWS